MYSGYEEDLEHLLKLYRRILNDKYSSLYQNETLKLLIDSVLKKLDHIQKIKSNPKYN